MQRINTVDQYMQIGLNTMEHLTRQGEFGARLLEAAARRDPEARAQYLNKSRSEKQKAIAATRTIMEGRELFLERPDTLFPLIVGGITLVENNSEVIDAENSKYYFDVPRMRKVVRKDKKQLNKVESNL